MTIWIETMEPERFFSFRWHPYAIEPGVDYSAEPTTLVSFTLEDAAGGTRLTIVESGFDAIPESRRAKAFSMNSAGWDGQAEEHPEVPRERCADTCARRSARATSDVTLRMRPTHRQHASRPREHDPHGRRHPGSEVRLPADAGESVGRGDARPHRVARRRPIGSCTRKRISMRSRGSTSPRCSSKSRSRGEAPRSKAEIIELLRTEGERQAQWLEQLPEAFLAERVRFPGGGSVSRFEMSPRHQGA